MPIIERKVVHSFSSEDTNFPASNLLETRVTKKYKCKEVGEKLVFVVFKLVKPTQIVTIDIGNEHSAFIEVFVASSKQNTPEFKVNNIYFSLNKIPDVLSVDLFMFNFRKFLWHQVS